MTKYIKISTESSDVAYFPPLWRHTSLLHMGVVALHIPSWRVQWHEERRQTHKTVRPVNARRVIFCYQNHLCGITNHHKHIWDVFGEEWVTDLSMITMNHIDPGAKMAAGTRSPLWCTRLLDTRSCNFTHPAVRGNHYRFAPKIHAVML